MMNLKKHAETELDAIGMTANGDEMGGAMRKHILHMVEEFSKAGHSGGSAGIAIPILCKVLNWEPLCPLTGKDDEWIEVDYGPDMVAQNKRCSHVFKGSDGRAYDSTGIVYRETSGSCFTADGSRVYIEFPYTPMTSYVDRPAPSCDE